MCHNDDDVKADADYHAAICTGDDASDAGDDPNDEMLVMILVII